MGKGRLSMARWRMLAIAAIAAAGLVALPTAALAKTVTRVAVASKFTINHDAGVAATPVSMKATLQKKISGSHYHGMAGTVVLYRQNPESGSYAKVTSKKAPSSGIVTFSISGQGKYRLSFATTKTMKAATSYSEVFKTIGVTI